MYLPTSSPPLIDTDKCRPHPPRVTRARVVCQTPPPRVTRARACLSSICLRSVRVPRHPSPPLLRLQLLDSAWSGKVRAYRCQASWKVRAYRCQGSQESNFTSSCAAIDSTNPEQSFANDGSEDDSTSVTKPSATTCGASVDNPRGTGDKTIEAMGENTSLHAPSVTGCLINTGDPSSKIVSKFRLYRDSYSQMPTVAETPSAPTLARSNLICLPWFDNVQTPTLVTIIDRVTVQRLALMCVVLLLLVLSLH